VGLVGIAVVRVVSDARFALVASRAQLVRRTPDDAWYYLTVARNLAAGHGPTFDGHDRTNGFQPLWQAVEGALAWWWHGTALVRAALVTGQLLTVIGVAAALWVTHRVIGLGWIGVGLAAVVVASPPVWSRLCDGMETPTVVLTTAVLAGAVAWWWRSPSGRRFAVVGVASGLCCLARTSTAVVVLAVPMVLLAFGPLAERSARRLIRSSVAWTAGLAALTLPWVAWSWAVVGSPVQTSSRVKWHWARVATGSVWSTTSLGKAWGALTEELWRQVRLGLDVAPGTPSLLRRAVELAAVVALGWLVVRWTGRDRASLVVLVPAGLLVARVLASEWYAAPVLVVSVTAAATVVVGAFRRAASRVGHRSRWAAAALAVVAVAFGIWAPLLPNGLPSGTWGLANLEAGRELARFPGRAGAFDAGVVGWIHPGTVNLDGLVRSPASVDRLLATRPDRVAIDDRIDYLVGRMAPGDIRLPSCARRVWTSPTVVGLPGQGRIPVGIWRLSDCGR
jgi:hypothetical protein